MTAANQIAQTIISDSYFLKLYRVCVERSVLRTLNIDTEEKYTEKEIRDLLRFADLLSTSSISDARNYAYKIITYLNPYYKDLICRSIARFRMKQKNLYRKFPMA